MRRLLAEPGWRPAMHFLNFSLKSFVMNECPVEPVEPVDHQPSKSRPVRGEGRWFGGGRGGVDAVALSEKHKQFGTLTAASEGCNSGTSL